MSHSNSHPVRRGPSASDPRSTVTCPLCGKECKHHDHVRCHLHEEHKKSAIIDRYLDALATADR